MIKFLRIPWLCSSYEHFVMGMIRAVAKDFFDTVVKVTVITNKGKKCDHTVFTIREEQTPASVVIRKRSSSLVSQLQKSRNSTKPRELQIGIPVLLQGTTFPHGARQEVKYSASRCLPL